MRIDRGTVGHFKRNHLKEKLFLTLNAGPGLCDSALVSTEPSGVGQPRAMASCEQQQQQQHLLPSRLVAVASAPV
jgi:hypothetical protein